MKRNDLLAYLLMFFITLTLLSSYPEEGYGLKVTETVVEISENGFATISMTINLNQTEALAVIRFLGKPDTFTIKVVSADGAAVPFNIADGHFILNVLGVLPPIKLQYTTPTLTSKSGPFWNATLPLTQMTLLKLPKAAVMTGIDGVPEDIFVRDDRLNIILGPGDWVIRYFLLPETVQPPTPQPLNLLWTLAGLVIAGSGIGYILITRRKRVTALRPDDRKILQYITAVGGQAYESDIVRELNMPKSTVWRAIKRLSNANLVTVVREGNRVKVVAK